MSTGIVVDTSVWIEFFRNADSPLVAQVKALLREDRVVMVGMVIAEIVQGIRNRRESELVRRTLSVLRYVETTRADWEEAAERSAGLRKQGLVTPLSDLLIAVVALREGHEVLTVDPHFERIPGIKLRPPETP